MPADVVIRTLAKLLIPFVLLFALNVQFHGDFGPGGGFQAGVIFAAAFIIYSLVFGFKDANRLLSGALLRWLLSGGLLLYSSVGIACLFAGGNYLDYSTLASDPVVGQHIGIMLVELGVGITVFAAMASIFYAFESSDP